MAIEVTGYTCTKVSTLTSSALNVNCSEIVVILNFQNHKILNKGVILNCHNFGPNMSEELIESLFKN